uniref:(northern house mosquito) hypothetical protein n=1 Tax=Culex pipiens TaxID=7175 RepID=A0A8D8EUC3_CULPI
MIKTNSDYFHLFVSPLISRRFHETSCFDNNSTCQHQIPPLYVKLYWTDSKKSSFASPQPSSEKFADVLKTKLLLGRPNPLLYVCCLLHALLSRLTFPFLSCL